MEERTFLRRFKAATGVKPTEYAQSVRMEKARELLQFTKRTVDQIAWSVGYEDAYRFPSRLLPVGGFGAWRLSAAFRDRPRDGCCSLTVDPEKLPSYLDNDQ
jgi:AraC-like DNA-binding protein